MLIDNQIFTDPCGLNIAKHFEVHYRCIDKGKRFVFIKIKNEIYDLEQICSKLFFNCSKSKDFKCIQTIQEDFSCQCPSTICQYSIEFYKKRN